MSELESVIARAIGANLVQGTWGENHLERIATPIQQLIDAAVVRELEGLLEHQEDASEGSLIPWDYMVPVGEINVRIAELKGDRTQNH